MIVQRSDMSPDDTYFIFRNDGSEVEVVFVNGKIVRSKPEMTQEEKDYFKSGKHKDSYE